MADEYSEYTKVEYGGVGTYYSMQDLHIIAKEKKCGLCRMERMYARVGRDDLLIEATGYYNNNCKTHARYRNQ